MRGTIIHPVEWEVWLAETSAAPDWRRRESRTAGRAATWPGSGRGGFSKTVSKGERRRMSRQNLEASVEWGNLVTQHDRIWATLDIVKDTSRTGSCSSLREAREVGPLKGHLHEKKTQQIRLWSWHTKQMDSSLILPLFNWMIPYRESVFIATVC